MQRNAHIFVFSFLLSLLHSICSNKGFRIKRALLNSSLKLFSGRLLCPLEVSLEAKRSFEDSSAGGVCASAKVASAAIPSSPSGAAKAGREEQEWSAQRLLFLCPPPAPSSSFSSSLARCACALLWPTRAGMCVTQRLHSCSDPLLGFVL